MGWNNSLNFYMKTIIDPLYQLFCSFIIRRGIKNNSLLIIFNNQPVTGNISEIIGLL